MGTEGRLISSLTHTHRPYFKKKVGTEGGLFSPLTPLIFPQPVQYSSSSFFSFLCILKRWARKEASFLHYPP